MNIGLGQIIIIFLIIILLWGNAPQLISNVSKSLNDVLEMFKKTANKIKKLMIKIEKFNFSGEKGLEPLTYGFGDRCSTN